MACVRRRRNRWVIDFRDQNGKRRWESFRTRKEADEALATHVGAVKHSAYVAPSDLPSFKEVAEHWRAGKRGDHPTSTFAYWEVQVLKHLVPAFGGIRVDRLSVDRIERFRNELREVLAHSTVNQIVQTMGAILDDAARRGLIQRNPARLVRRARRMRVADNATEAVDPRSVLTADQARQLIENATRGIYRTFIMTAVLTGMRSGELLALRWDDIEFDLGILHVRRSLSFAKARDERGGKTQAFFGPPKTESSRRKVPIAAELTVALKAWRLECPKGPEGLVFPNSKGGPVHRSWMTKGLREALCRCPDLPRVTTHGTLFRLSALAGESARDPGGQSAWTHEPDHDAQALRALVRATLE